MEIVLAKFSVAGGCALTLWVALTLAGRLPMTTHVKLAVVDVPALWLLARALPLAVVYFILGFAPESDVATCFWPQAVGAAGGAVPYRDFESFFGPLFPHLLALPVLLWHDPRAILIWFSLLEAATIWLTMWSAGLTAPGPARTRFVLCAFIAPGPLMLSVVGGQEDFLVWLAGLSVWLLIGKSRESSAACVAAAAFLFTKAIFLLPFAGFVALVRRRARFVAIVATVGIATVVVLFALTGTEFLDVLGESKNISPPQVWLLLHFVSGGLIPAGGRWISFAVLLIAVAVAAVTSFRRAPELRESPRMFFACWTLLFATTIILMPKGQGPYVAYFLLPVLALAHAKPALLTVWVFAGALAATEPSLFYRLGERHPAGFSAINDVWGAVDIILQTCLVASIAWLGRASWRTVQNHASK